MTKKGKVKLPVYVTLVKDGNITKSTHSNEEAEALGLFNSKAYALIDTEDPLPTQSAGMTCECDNYTQREFERTGRLGCSQCYETFHTLIDPLLQRMHKDTSHVGKVPKNINNKKTLENRLAYLQEELNSAIKSERYEDAAHVRDEIKDFESEHSTKN